tara:strand:+ start:2918 stop:4069 length:1152 start_codon:yes stop_codon:yes gene_type:complete
MTILNVLKIFIITLFLFLFIDFCFGTKMLDYVINAKKNQYRKEQFAIEHKYRINHKVYNHALINNYEGQGSWGVIPYKVCTNDNGFRIKCGESTKMEDKYDLIIIGDSNTEGVSLDFEKTFVGKISENYPNKKIINMSVASYSPAIYLSKLMYYLKLGINVQHVLVIIDPSDLFNDMVNYHYKDGIVTSKNKEYIVAVDKDPDKHRVEEVSNFKIRSLKILSRYLFPLTYQGLHITKNYLLNITPREGYLPNPGVSWSFDKEHTGYKGISIKKGKQISFNYMDKLYKELSSRGIKLSVAVTPWPDHLHFDNENSSFVKDWKIFCNDRCFQFFNFLKPMFYFKEIFGAERSQELLYIKNDIHNNEFGHHVIAKSFIENQLFWDK